MSLLDVLCLVVNLNLISWLSSASLHLPRMSLVYISYLGTKMVVPHMKASWIFSANDVIVNMGVILAGVLVALTQAQLTLTWLLELLFLYSCWMVLERFWPWSRTFIMNLFQVKTKSVCKDCWSQKRGSIHQQRPSVLERLELLGFRVGESLQVLEKGLFGGDPILVQIETSRFALRKNEAERVFVEIINEH